MNSTYDNLCKPVIRDLIDFSEILLLEISEITGVSHFTKLVYTKDCISLECYLKSDVIIIYATLWPLVSNKVDFIIKYNEFYPERSTVLFKVQATLNELLLMIDNIIASILPVVKSIKEINFNYEN